MAILGDSEVDGTVRGADMGASQRPSFWRAGIGFVLSLLLMLTFVAAVGGVLTTSASVDPHIAPAKPALRGAISPE